MLVALTSLVISYNSCISHRLNECCTALDFRRGSSLRPFEANPAKTYVELRLLNCSVCLRRPPRLTLLAHSRRQVAGKVLGSMKKDNRREVFWVLILGDVPFPKEASMQSLRYRLQGTSRKKNTAVDFHIEKNTCNSTGSRLIEFAIEEERWKKVELRNRL